MLCKKVPSVCKRPSPPLFPTVTHLFHLYGLLGFHVTHQATLWYIHCWPTGTPAFWLTASGQVSTFLKVLPAFVAQDAKGLLCIFSDPAQTAYISRKGLLSVEELHPETTPGDELCSALLGSLALGL